MIKSATLVFYAIFYTTLSSGEVLKGGNGETSLKYEPTSDGLKVELFGGEKLRLSGTVGKGIDFTQVPCSGGLCQINDNYKLSISPLESYYNLTFEGDPKLPIESCFLLYSNTTHWYGGPQRYYQIWPLEKMVINGSDPYIIKGSDNFGVAERYWLSSDGTYVFLSDNNPLWVDQNNKEPDQVCFKSEIGGPYINRWRLVHSLILSYPSDPKKAHLEAVNLFLGKPASHPNEKMVAEPIWTTWAKYKKDIDDATVLKFANEIRSHGYKGGQLEVDDEWEKCYGAQEFTTTTFPDIENTVRKLHDDGWRVTLWVHPFVNDNCQNNSAVGKEMGYFVRNTTNQTLASWWDGENSHQIDFTNPEAAQWWVARLRKLQQSPGIDSFKFDAGESDYVNQPPVFQDVENSPNILTQKYIETCATFGDFIEYRASFRGQRYGKFIRMLDKDSNWGLQNGLATLITTLLQMNMNGYGMVLPDMIGGNGYLGQIPTAELVVRWTQANTFMPAMQFSYLPWDYKDKYDVESIIKKYVDLHKQYAPNIIKAMNASINTGTPVNPPIWWVDSTDSIALGVADEYLLGEEILVAPVIVEGATSRDVYLPKGQWRDGNNGTVYTGPITLENYDAPIEVLPYFIKQ